MLFLNNSLRVSFRDSFTFFSSDCFENFSEILPKTFPRNLLHWFLWKFRQEFFQNVFYGFLHKFLQEFLYKIFFRHPSSGCSRNSFRFRFIYSCKLFSDIHQFFPPIPPIDLCKVFNRASRESFWKFTSNSFRSCSEIPVIFSKDYGLWITHHAFFQQFVQFSYVKISPELLPQFILLRKLVINFIGDSSKNPF